jgi:putative ABC transport system permease protein
MTAETAHAEFMAMAHALEIEHPDTNRGRQLLVLQADRAMGGPNLYLVMTLLVGTAALVMVIASANVAGVLLARAVARRREFGLRVALGARATRVFRQLIAEGLLLAVLGGIGGLIAAEAGLRLIRSAAADPIFQQIVIDMHEVLFVMLLALAAPLLFSIAPALALLRADLVGVLNATGPRSGGSGSRARQGLVVAQLALAVMLATVGGLVTRTALAMTTAPTGFDPSNVVTFVLALDQHSPDAAARRQLVANIREGLMAAANISTGAVDLLPAISVEQASAVEPDGIAAEPRQIERWAYVIGVDDGALATIGVPLLEGRGLTGTDVETNAAVALISTEAARRYFGATAAAVGRRLTIRADGVTQTRQIVGVTGDVRNVEPERGTPPRVWIPLSAPRTTAFVIRTTGDTRAAAESVRRVARELAPAIPVESLDTYDLAIRRRGGSDRVAMGMLISFAAVAVLFAAIGLYGTVALSVSLRRAEFGTRFALGAQVRDVAGMVLAQAFRLLAVGLAIGLAAGLVAGSAMRRMLYGVTPLDPLNLVGVVALLTVVTLLASVMPAWRAARVDVVDALRPN